MSVAVVPWGDVFKGVLTIQGGIHPALFLLFVGGIGFAVWIVWKAYQAVLATRAKENAEWAQQREQQFEKRHEEQRATLIALEHTATGMATLTASVEAASTPVQGVVQGLALLVSTQEASRQAFKEQANRIEQGQAEIIKLLNEILRGQQ